MQKAIGMQTRSSENGERHMHIEIGTFTQYIERYFYMETWRIYKFGRQTHSYPKGTHSNS